MIVNVYTVVKILNGQCDEVSAFDTEEAAVEYAQQTIKGDDYDIVSIYRIILNNPNVQLSIREFRKGKCG
ncbi:hypothetical protein [Desulforamulus aquiferis]|uniref:Uncharacterized protein n=1 Tax=Desulforamulus aquiferis TaxID=1397668 RepID=A0AAW7ZC53_9FIRM|nr:hypothetical protein [Desulforamulus aquiferis]MDO7786972.1 hypothetical protein [Desulforamulus aquiferis]RYD03879.1 hypothetical protein N752_17510 [Desulforamulus aquiferis]